MKAIKRLPILFAFMLILVGLPVTGAFAVDNGEKTETQTEKAENQNNKNEIKNNENQIAQKENQDDLNENQGEQSKNQDMQSENLGEQNDDTDEPNVEQDENTKKQDKDEEVSASVKAEEKNEIVAATDTPDEADTEESESNENDETAPVNDSNKSTQIHLHIANCLAPVEKGFVQVNGDWYEMTNPGSSPLYKLFDDGEFVKDDITAFKLIFTSGEELVVSVSDLKVGVEAEGSVNYWLENCELPEGEATSPEKEELKFLSIKLMIDISQAEIDHASLVMMNGKKIKFEMLNNLLTLNLTEELVLEMVHGIEITSKGQTKLILLSQLSKDLFDINDGVLTVKLNWDTEGTIIENETEERTKEEDEDREAAPVNNSNNSSGNSSDGTETSQEFQGDVLPQTGESSRAMYYVLGLLIAAWGIMLRFKNNLKNY